MDATRLLRFEDVPMRAPSELDRIRPARVSSSPSDRFLEVVTAEQRRFLQALGDAVDLVSDQPDPLGALAVEQVRLTRVFLDGQRAIFRQRADAFAAQRQTHAASMPPPIAPDRPQPLSECGGPTAFAPPDPTATPHQQDQGGGPAQHDGSERLGAAFEIEGVIGEMGLRSLLDAWFGNEREAIASAAVGAATTEATNVRYEVGEVRHALPHHPAAAVTCTDVAAASSWNSDVDELLGSIDVADAPTLEALFDELMALTAPDRRLAGPGARACARRDGTVTAAR